MTPDEWIDRFAHRLGAVVPGITPEAATQAGRETWGQAQDLSPEEAAEIYGAELPPADEGSGD